MRSRRKSFLVFETSTGKGGLEIFKKPVVYASSLVPSSLVKMLYWMCEKSNLPPTEPQLEHAICRNFGGMESDELDTLEEFQRYILIRNPPDLQSIPEEVQMYLPCVYTLTIDLHPNMIGYSFVPRPSLSPKLEAGKVWEQS